VKLIGIELQMVGPAYTLSMWPVWPEKSPGGRDQLSAGAVGQKHRKWVDTITTGIQGAMLFRYLNTWTQPEPDAVDDIQPMYLASPGLISENCL